ncbi:MAG: ribonucleotide reductase subunit alpha [Alphaproteobacteria bacterium]|nr:ribonucleotide reductase subunit alpha [Alphaproteobacteria bacterium]
MVNITNYADLLQSARMQPDAQRLLFVFASAELPDDADEIQKERFRAGEGGTLSPVMCVDKLPVELSDFPALVEESRQTGASWDIVFVAGMSGVADIPPSSDEAEQPLMMMVEAIKNGHLGNLLAFNMQGEIVQFS